MFLPSRFVAIDDREDHLDAIGNAIHSEGGLCLCVKYDPAVELAASIFGGVRVLLIDLHLTSGTTTSDNRPHYAVIAGILENVISPNGGPFVLVLWTEHPQTRDELRQYLDQSIDPDKSYARPIAVLAIDKSMYIEIGTGKPRAGAPSLHDAVKDAVNENPQLAALLRWEMEVVSAAASTLSSILDLVPADHRTSAKYSASLDVTMSRLAVAALGSANAGQNPRAAINSALAPILSDRILNQDDVVGSDVAWKAALTKTNDAALGYPDEHQAGRVNGMLHVARPSAETILPSDWGAVVAFPYAVTEEKILELFGISLADLKRKVFRVKHEGPDRWPDCGLRLVRIGAVCDYAQNKAGPITYLLAVEMPLDAISNSSRKSAPDSEWRSPVLAMAEVGTTVELVVNCRFPVVVAPAAVAQWQPAYRIRETLLMDMITHSAEYSARPGYIKAEK